jgi:hypothetical protein
MSVSMWYATLHVSVINLDHLQGYCSCCNATIRFVVFFTTLSEHVAVFSVCVAVVCTLLLLVLLYTVKSVFSNKVHELVFKNVF